MDNISGLLLAALSFFSSIIVASIKGRRSVQGGTDAVDKGLDHHSFPMMFSHLSGQMQSLLSSWLLMVLARLGVPPPLPPKPTRKHGTAANSKPSLPSTDCPKVPLRQRHTLPQQQSGLSAPLKSRHPPVIRDSASPSTSGILRLLLDPFNLPSDVLAPSSGQPRRRQYFGLRSVGEVGTEEEDISVPISLIPVTRHGQLDRQRLADSLRYGVYAKDMEDYRRLEMKRSPPTSRRNSIQSMNPSRFLRTTSGEVMSVPSVLVSTCCQDTVRHPKDIRALPAFRPVGATPQPTSQLARVSSGVLYSATVARRQSISPPSMLSPHSFPGSQPLYTHRPSRTSSSL